MMCFISMSAFDADAKYAAAPDAEIFDPALIAIGHNFTFYVFSIDERPCGPILAFGGTGGRWGCTSQWCI